MALARFLPVLALALASALAVANLMSAHSPNHGASERSAAAGILSRMERIEKRLAVLKGAEEGLRVRGKARLREDAEEATEGAQQEVEQAAGAEAAVRQDEDGTAEEVAEPTPSASALPAAVVPGHLPYDCMGVQNGFGITTDACHMEARAEYWGDVVLWGTENTKASAAECCQSCRDHGKCNVWVFCGDQNGCGSQKFGECWLKRQVHPSIARTSAARAPPGQPPNPWTSGALYEDNRSTDGAGARRKFHVLMTSNASPYVQWQSRVSYYHYKKLRDAHPESGMGGFTRVLHSGQPDHLMDEIPTVVVDKLRNDHGFVVLSRPYALQQWFEKFADTIPEDYVLMSEPDHLFLRPMPNLMVGEEAAAFPFFYIDPPKYPELIRKYIRADMTMEEIAQVAPIGNSPVMLSKADLGRIAKPWAEVVVQMKTDPEADKAWGWVLEMWAYTVTAYKVGVKHHLYPELAAQPPWDQELKDFYILHYTYGCDYTRDGVFTPGKIGEWRFDKRSYMGRAPPRNLAPPPRAAPALVHTLVAYINEATSALPWP